MIWLSVSGFSKMLSSHAEKYSSDLKPHGGLFVFSVGHFYVNIC